MPEPRKPIPRYVPPPREVPEAKPEGLPPEAEDWELALRLWWAISWRTWLITIPASLLLNIFLALVFGNGAETGMFQTMIAVLFGFMLGVLIQVAVLRHMLRKKRFVGFTLEVKRRSDTAQQ